MGRIIRSLGGALAAGAAALFGVRSLTSGGERMNDGDEVDLVAVLTTKQLRSVCESFMGGDITVAGGVAYLDLRQAETGPTGAEIGIGGFGGVVRITIPSHWRTEVTETGWLGSTTDKSSSIADADAPVLRVRSELKMGRVIIDSLPQLKAVG